MIIYWHVNFIRKNLEKPAKNFWDDGLVIFN